MNKTFTLQASLLTAAFLLWPSVQAQSMTKVDYKASKARISAAYKADKSACASLADNAKDVCVEEAKAKEKVARADLEYGYTGKAGDRNKARVVKAETVYAVAKERFDDLAGNPKDVCVKEAKAVKVSALADAKLGKDIGDARSDAAADKQNANYKVAAEKCEALAGDAKIACVAAAKASFGKN